MAAKKLFCPFSSDSLPAIQEADKFEKCPLSCSCSSPCIEPSGSKAVGGILIVGEAPGADEDAGGQCFVGRSGRLLRQALESSGIAASAVTFTNAVRCRPPGNQKPSARVTTLCSSLYLRRTVSEFAPKVVVVVGSTAAKALLGGKEIGITSITGTELLHGDAGLPPVVASIHPAFALRNIRAYFPDLLAAMAKVKEVYDREVASSGPATAVARPAFDVFVPKYRSDLRELLTRLYSMSQLPRGSYVSYDVETNGLSPWFNSGRAPQVLTLSLSTTDESAVVIPFQHPQAPQWSEAELAAIKKAVSAVLTAPQLVKVGHNMKFDNEWLSVVFGIEPSAPDMIGCMPGMFDTMLAHALIYPLRQHGLDALSIRHCGGKYGDYWSEVHSIASTSAKESRARAAKLSKTAGSKMKSVIDKERDKLLSKDFSLVPLQMLATYNAYDTMVTLNLLPELVRLLGDTGTLNTLCDVVMPASKALQDMEMSGMCISPSKAAILAGECSYNVLRLDREIKALPEVQEIEAEKVAADGGPKKDANGEPRRSQVFNPKSTHDVATLLYTKLGLPVISETPSGAPSTDKKTLKALEIYPEVDDRALSIMHLLSDRSEYDKVLSTYLRSIPKYLGTDGKVHTNYVLLCRTGRISSRNPNLQNQPSGVRKIYVSRFEGGEIIVADFSQLEARVAACYSKDPMLCDIFQKGLDFHIINAALMLGKDPGNGKKGDSGEITDEDRSRAKSAVSFGLMYGRAARALAKDLRISLAEAEEMIAKYFSRVQVFRAWCKDVMAYAREHGYVTTMFGRRRGVPDIWSDDEYIRSEAERVAVNTPIQGTASDMTLCALVRLKKRLSELGMRAVPVVTVHDSIGVDSPEDEIDRVKALMHEVMEDTSMYPWAIVPFTIEIKAANSWDADATKLTKTHKSAFDWAKYEDDGPDFLVEEEEDDDEDEIEEEL